MAWTSFGVSNVCEALKTQKNPRHAPCPQKSNRTAVGLSRASTSLETLRWKTWMAGHRRAEAMPSFGRLCPAMTEDGMSCSTRKLARKHLFKNLPADGLVGERRVLPPPAVLFHLGGGSDKAFGHLGEIGVGGVQAEDQSPG